MSLAPGRVRQGVHRAVLAVVTDDCEWSCGNATSLGLSCVFGLTLLKFWFLNGLIDFSTALAVGSVASPVGLAVRLTAYVLVVPTFVGLRLAYYAAHPAYRRALRGGSCPSGGPLRLDWFTVGILATGLPIALRDLGPWLGMTAVFLVGLFAVPRVLDGRAAANARLGSIVVGSALFAYTKYGWHWPRRRRSPGRRRSWARSRRYSSATRRPRSCSSSPTVPSSDRSSSRASHWR